MKRPTTIPRLLTSIKRNQGGFVHHVAVVGFVVLFAVIGVGYLVATHAATITVQAGDPASSNDAPATPLASDISQTDSTLGNDYDPAAVPDASVSCKQYAQWLEHDSKGENYWLNPDRYGNGHQCPRNGDGRADFTVYNGGGSGTPKSGVQAYPNLIKGCSSTGCVSGGFPIAVDNVPHYYASGNITTHDAGGAWDANYDLWFNRTDNVGPSRGTEILINLNRKGRNPPAHYYSKETNVQIGGGSATYDVYTYRQSAGSRTWNFVEYWARNEVYSTTNMNLVNFMHHTETMTCPGNTKCLYDTWYWTGVDTGFELWNSGYGLEWSNVVITP